MVRHEAWLFNPLWVTQDPLCSVYVQMKSSDAEASKCHLKFSSRMIIFIKLLYLSSVISLKWQW